MSTETNLDAMTRQLASMVDAEAEGLLTVTVGRFAQATQVYALASIAESLARIANALDAQNDNDDAAFNREL